MLQIIVVMLFLASGLFLLAKGELQATSTRVVRGTTARLLGAGFCSLAALPIVLDVFTGTVIAMALFLAASAIAIATAPASPRSDSVARTSEPAPIGPQIAGETCIACSTKIVLHSEATSCTKCGKPVHHDCLRAHRQAAHPKKKRRKSAA